MTVVRCAISTVFHRYAELDQPCLIEAVFAASQEHHQVTVEVTGRHGGEPVLASVLTGPLS